MSYSRQPMQDEFYLGDGVYVGHDGWAVWLQTERSNGWHQIALEPEILDSLVKYVARLRGKNEG